MILKTYENKSGYRIQATEKAYRLLYEKQGFRPVAEMGGKKGITEMTVAELRTYLDEQGIAYDAKAKKADLIALAEGKTGGGSTDKATDGGNGKEDEGKEE